MRSLGKFSRQFFRWGIRSFGGRQRSYHHSFEMAHRGRGEHLSGAPEPGRLRDRVSAENGGSVGGEGGGSQYERCKSTSSLDGTFFKGAFIRLRQARANQLERQVAGPCGHSQKSRVGRQLFSLCRLGGGPLLGSRSSFRTNDFRCDEGPGIMRSALFHTRRFWGFPSLEGEFGAFLSQVPRVIDLLLHCLLFPRAYSAPLFTPQLAPGGRNL